MKQELIDFIDDYIEENMSETPDPGRVWRVCDALRAGRLQTGILGR